MNRVAFAYWCEFAVAYPPSASGKGVKSEHGVDFYGDPIEEDVYVEPDEAIDGEPMIDRISQGGLWRDRIDKAVGYIDREVLRMLYCDNAGRKEKACRIVGCYISAKTGAGQSIAINECRHEAALMCINPHDHASRELLLDLIRSATRKADRVLG